MINHQAPNTTALILVAYILDKHYHVASLEVSFPFHFSNICVKCHEHAEQVINTN